MIPWQSTVPETSVPRGKHSLGAAAAPRATARVSNPLHDLIAAGKMPVILELHLTESDRSAYQQLRQRHIARGYELPQLTVLGQYLRQIDVTSTELTEAEQRLAHKLQIYADLVSSGVVDLLALDDGSRGRDTLDNAVAAALLMGLGADPARLMANVVARNRLPDQIRRRLLHFAELGVRNILLLTGDLPVDRGRPARFPLDSLGMLELTRRMLIEEALPEDFWAAAAGHPNPDADPGGLRTLQKALAGAKVIITQAIYSVEQFTDWMQALQRLGVLDTVHVLAEVIPITSASQLRLIADVPGMRVPVDLIAQMDAVERRIEHTAQAGGHSPDWAKTRVRSEGVRVTRELLHRIRKVSGVSGFYLGCVKAFDAHLELLKEAPLLPEHGQGLHKVAKISGAERQRALAQGPAVEEAVNRIARRIRRRRERARLTRWLTNRRWAEAILKVVEWPKVPIFGCKKCDRCDLSPDGLVCPRGCAKEMSHGPCGAPRLVNGRMLCEDTSRECTWAAIGRRRDLYGVPVADRLEVRPAPSPGFYEGKTYSSFLPVLDGRKEGPSWDLAWRVPLAHVIRLLRPSFAWTGQGSARDLVTLAASKAEQVREILAERPEADSEELFFKVLALIGTPAAWCLLESRLASLGLPAEGTLADLSLGEQFQLAEALPAVRRRFSDSPQKGGGDISYTHCEELLAAVPEGRRLRRAIRRELANGLIAHIGSLGVSVTYTEVLLDTKHVDDFLTALTILKDELQITRNRLPLTHGILTVEFHRVHYKHHYHAPIALQRFCDQDQRPTNRAILRVDLRQYQNATSFRLHLRDSLERLLRGDEESTGAICLEPYRPGSQSLCWQFNAEFWRRLREFEQAKGVSYDASIGGSTDRNQAYARAAARAFIDKIHDHALGGQRLYVLEIGVASVHRARSFLDECRRICDLTGKDDYRNVTYLLADFSEAILAKSGEELSGIHPSVETVRMDAADPFAALAAYKGRVLHAHLCNVYDNLPCDQALWQDEQWHLIDVRLYLHALSLETIASQHGLEEKDRKVLREMLQTLHTADGPAVGGVLDWLKSRFAEMGRPASSYIGFWMDLFAALRLDERFVAVADMAELLLTKIPGIEHPGELLRRHLFGAAEARIHLNQAALCGFAQMLALLHPRGTLEVVDLFVQRIEEYQQAFKGPAKYDGSTVNWLNGPLFRAVAEHLGYTVRFQPFRPFDPKSPSVVLLAYGREQPETPRERQ